MPVQETGYRSRTTTKTTMISTTRHRMYPPDSRADFTTAVANDSRGSFSPVPPPRRSKNVSVQQMNQILDDVKSEQSRNVVVDTLAALVTDVNATAQVLRRSASRERVEADRGRRDEDKAREKPELYVLEKCPTEPEIEYRLRLVSPVHSELSVSPVQSLPKYQKTTDSLERSYSLEKVCSDFGIETPRERSLSRARSETPVSRKLIILQEPQKKEAPVCASCGQEIFGPCMTALAPNSTCAQKYHPFHFICTYCTKPLNLRGTYKEYQRKPYCHECFYRLYSGHIYEVS